MHVFFKTCLKLWLGSLQNPPSFSLKGAASPILIMHSQDDEYIPFSLGKHVCYVLVLKKMLNARHEAEFDTFFCLALYKPFEVEQ